MTGNLSRCALYLTGFTEGVHREEKIRGGEKVGEQKGLAEKNFSFIKEKVRSESGGASGVRQFEPPITELALKMSFPPRYIEKVSFSSSENNAGRDFSGEETYGTLADTYGSDNTYYTYERKIGGVPAYVESVRSETWNLYAIVLFPAVYTGTATIEFRGVMYRNGLSALTSEHSKTITVDSNYVINNFIEFELVASFYWEYLKSSVAGTTYYQDKWKISLYLYVVRNDGTKENVASWEGDLVNSDDSSNQEYVTGVALGIDFGRVSSELRYGDVISRDRVTSDGRVLHGVEFDVPFAGTTVKFLNLPYDWFFYTSNPVVEWDSSSRSFVAPVSGFYTVWFESYDVWRYVFDEARISYHTSRGETLPYDAFHTYLATAPERLIRYAPDPRDPSLVAWFRFNEGTGTTVYDWAKGYEGKVNGASWTTGYIGKALYFDGSDDCVDIDDVAGEFVEQDFTVELWFNWERGDGIDTIFGRWTSSGGNLWLIAVEGNQIYFYTESTGRKNFGEITPHRWYHLAVERKSKEWRLFLDGRFVFSVSVSVDESASDKVSIGQDWDSSWRSDWFKGRIDEVRIYKRVLSVEEVWWHYALVFYYDGVADLMGRDPSFVAPTGVEYERGLYGYATHIDGKYTSSYSSAVAYDADDSRNIAVRSGTLIVSLNVYGSYAVGTWSDLVTVGSVRLEWHGSANDGFDSYGSYYDEGGTYRSLRLWFPFYTKDEFGTWEVLELSYGPTGIAYGMSDEGIKNTTYPEGLIFYPGSLGFRFVEYGKFNVSFDEVIVLRVQLGPEEMKNIYELGKKYVGGTFSASDFLPSMPINFDSDESGVGGFSEDFSDVSEWVNTWSAADSYSFTVVGNSYGKMYMECKADSGDGDGIKYTVDVTDFDLTKYPFLEVRWKGETNESTYFIIAADVLVDGTNYYLWLKHYVGSFDWTVDRLNLYEIVKSKYSGSEYKLNKISFVLGDYPDEAAQYAILYIDWLRIYGFVAGNALGSGADSGEVAADYGGRALLQVTTDDDGAWDIVGFYLTVGSIYYEAGTEIEVSLKYENSGGGKIVFKVRYISGSTVDVISTELSEPGHYILHGTIEEAGSYRLYILLHESSPSPGFAYAQKVWIEYIKIGEKRCVASDVKWVAALDPVYTHPSGAEVWFNITDIWGNQLFYGHRSYSPYQDFVFSVYSWKFYNGLDGEFIHINITNGGYWWSEWLAPHEVAKYVLYPDSYTLKVTYPNGSWFTVSLDVNTDSYWMLLGSTLGDVLRGIGDVIDNITAVNRSVYLVNETISDLVFNVNLTVTAWNSEINNTVVNIDIHLENVNSTLGDMIMNVSYDIENLQTNVTNQINWVLLNVSNVNSTILEQINDLSLNISNYYSDLNNSIVSVNISIENYYSDLSSQIVSVNTSVLNLQNNVTTQINWVVADIENVNATILKQINNLSAYMYQYYSDLNMSITSINVSVNNQYSNISQQLVTIEGYVINVNSTLERVNATLYAEISIVGNGVNETYHRVVVGVDSIEEQVRETGNMVGRAATETRRLGTKFSEFEYWTKILVGVFGVVAVAGLITAMLRSSRKGVVGRPVSVKRKSRLLVYGEIREEISGRRSPRKKKSKRGEWDTIESLKVKNVIKEWRE